MYLYPNLRLKLRNFWSDETRLPGTTLERLVEVLRAMYSTNTESQVWIFTTVSCHITFTLFARIMLLITEMVMVFENLTPLIGLVQL